jgi:hypothetical protein
MRRGDRVARAEYRAAVSPAGPDPIIVNFFMWCGPWRGKKVHEIRFSLFLEVPFGEAFLE